jgi:hypothetical protein
MTYHYALILRKDGSADFIHTNVDKAAGIEMDLATKYNNRAFGSIDGPYYLIVYTEK